MTAHSNPDPAIDPAHADAPERGRQSSQGSSDGKQAPGLRSPWALASGVVAFLLYAVTAAPTITWRNDGADSGELAAAVMTLGVAHPPGYPAYVLLGRVATLVVPFGDPAHRLALFSALGGATAVGLVVVLAAQLAPVRGWAGAAGTLLAGLALAASPLLWSQATIPEVYAPAAAFLGGGLLLFAAWLRRGKGPWLIGALGLLLGFGAGIHLTVLFLALAAAPLVGVRASTRDLFSGVLGLALGLSVFALVPVLASRHPPIAWGDPTSLSGFLWTVTGAPYRDLVLGLPLDDAPHRLLTTAGVLARQFGPVGWLLALWGGSVLWRAHRAFLTVGLLLAVISLVYAVGYRSRDSLLYLLPVVLVGALCLAHGAIALFHAAVGWRRWAGGVAVVACSAAVPALSLVANFRALDVSRDREAFDYAATASHAAGPDGLVLGDTDEYVFSLWYHEYVFAPEGSPDVIARTLLQFPWYRNQLRRRYPGLLPGEPLTYDEAVRAVLAVADRRPLYVTFEDPVAAESSDLHPAGPLYRVAPRQVPDA